MKHSNTPFSLRRDYIVFSAIVVAVVIGLVVLTGLSIYISQSRDRSIEYNVKADVIDRVLTESLDYIGHTLNLIGEQIVETKSSNASIRNILVKYASNAKIQSLLSWTVYDWVNPDNQIIINSTHGILKEPVTSSRSHLKQTRHIQGKLFFSDADMGLVSKQLVIPAGVGIKDEQGKFFGTLNIGILVNGLIGRIEQSLDTKTTNFILISRDSLKVIAESSGNSGKEKDSHIFATILKPLMKKGGDAGILRKPINYGNREYNYYRYSSYYPFIILTGADKSLASNDFWQVSFPRIMEITFMGVFAIVLLYYFRKRIVNPIIALSKVAERIVREPEVTIPQGDYAEVAILAKRLEEIQQMKKQLVAAKEAENSARRDAETAHSQVQEINNTLEQRVIERTEFLQDALNARQDFLNHISHEIRTPVSCIYARSSLLLEMWAEFSHEELKESIQDVQNNSLRLCDMVTSLLDLSKARAGKMVYDMQEQDIAAIAAQVVEECRPLYQRKSLMLTLENKAENSVTLCDEMRIAQVIRNLLANACRYTPEGMVHLTITNADMHCEDGRTVAAIAIYLKDEGVGIPPGELNKIFEAFTQSSKTNTKAGGTGLGLAISREIITAHHGQLWAENNHNGKGSVFVVMVPAAPYTSRSRA